MPVKRNSITWITRGSHYTTKADVNRVEILHSRGQREADGIRVLFDFGPYRYHMTLNRQENGEFEGICEKIELVSEKQIDARPVRCCLHDSLQDSALILSLTPWVDDLQGESDWMGHFKTVQRIICKDQTFSS